MVDGAIRKAIRQLGSRGAVLGNCPVCGRAVTPSHDRVEVWRGKHAHRSCAEYEPRHAARRHVSRRVHGRFTRQ
jgi:hypothetical protein